MEVEKINSKINLIWDDGEVLCQLQKNDALWLAKTIYEMYGIKNDAP